MLCSLNIENIALIDKLELPLSGGFVVLTGETGAGKSIIIDSVNLLTGGRADRDLIKSGSDRAVAEGVFSMTPQIAERLSQLGIETGGDDLILSRELSASGRNVCRINGRLAPLTLLKAAGTLVVDIHGQHDSAALLNVEKHIEFLDAYGKKTIAPISARVEADFAAWHDHKQMLKSSLGSTAELSRREDMLNYQIEEITQVEPFDGEDDKLFEEEGMLKNAEEIKDSLSQSCYEIFGGEDSTGALQQLQSAVNRLEHVSSVSSRLKDLFERLKDTAYIVEDIGAELRSQREEVQADPYRLEEIESRLDSIYRLKKKYGETIGHILQYRAKAQEELEQMEEKRRMIENGAEEEIRLRGILEENTRQLSDARKTAAKSLEEAMTAQLKELGMEKASFKIQFSQIERGSFSPKGTDLVEMLFSANAGEPPRPLHKVASGGELSRIMLAFKSIEANLFSCDCLIFDEIDTGISGKTAAVVGEKMRELSKQRQVLCVTHSPAIAAMADEHLLIEKLEKNGKTFTTVRKLQKNERVMELARIISGDNPGESAVAHARELMEKVR